MIHPNSAKREIFRQDENVGWELACLAHHDVVELQVKTAIAAHSVPLDMTFYVVSGSGLCEVEGNPTSLGTGDVLAVPPGVERSWTNTGDAPLRLLAIRGHRQD
ncbi:MAG: cupin domain-containing protein [Lentisphaerae bacterium]|nr:cupin domain-containing protein [Lentisphaerota bacterium]MBT4820888.1 cupin domain-containing protein [Lentisphaerota bacterium]MBT5608203.1 cupin domain-containing protein [Lentisphaerota bacterium]MBT7058908.1 cupin domain-containing protein [Lentisphaerota bacterium]MBT7842861.1 cupin domain-containing protein [Lentisphaerota bacterium]